MPLEERVKVELPMATILKLNEYNEKHCHGAFSSFEGLILRILRDNEELRGKRQKG